MLHRLLTFTAALALLLTGALALGGTPSAQAAWRLTSPPAPAAAAATRITTTPTPSVTTASVLGGVYVQYTLTWPSVGMTNGMAVTGYQVSKAMVSGGGTLLSGGTCTGTLSMLNQGTAKALAHAAGSTQTCTEQALVSAGTPKYQITPVFGNYWRGTSSPWVTAPSA